VNRAANRLTRAGAALLAIDSASRGAVVAVAAGALAAFALQAAVAISELRRPGHDPAHCERAGDAGRAANGAAARPPPP
jgi:hypothetical protein